MLKSVTINTLIIALAVLIQSTLLHYIAVYGVIPDLVLILVLFVSLKEGSKVGEFTGFFGGILVDFLSLAPLGFHGLIYCVIGFFAGLSNRNISTESLLTQFIFIVTATFTKYIVSSLIIVLFSIETTSMTIFGRNFLLELAYTILIAPIFFTVANRIYDMSHRKRVGL